MENTDRELLEMAAKAVGIEATWVRNSGAFYYDNPETGHEIFDPLTDDGDALRLAVKLSLIDECQWKAPVTGAVYDECGGDWYAATRRAIVRAAAEIGKVMT